MDVALPGAAAALPPAGALVVAGTDGGPGRQMKETQKCAHSDCDLGDEQCGDEPVDIPNAPARAAPQPSGHALGGQAGPDRRASSESFILVLRPGTLWISIRASVPAFCSQSRSVSRSRVIVRNLRIFLVGCVQGAPKGMPRPKCGALRERLTTWIEASSGYLPRS